MAQTTNILLESGTNELEIVVFFINERTPDGREYCGYYGVNVAKVLEIIRLPQVTEMPGQTNASVRGSFNLRGRVIPLVDLARWLGKTCDNTEDDKVIVTEFNSIVNAFRVSGVTRIHRLSWDAIEAPNIHVQRFSQESITGVVRLDERVVFILDMEMIVGELNPSLALQSIDEEEDHGDSRLKTLIADDSATIRHMMGSSLEKGGFEVTRTINGQKAWEQLEAWHQEAEAASRPMTDYVQVIVSDIEMPGMDGHSLTRRIKEDPRFKNLPVILFSSLITDKLRHKGEAVGADDQISKPEMRELAARARVLADKAMASEPTAQPTG
ncbi:chemotaxis protein [Desulfohalovibrio reitneri]|uniref:chemotaxis protein n=1 Tax=Desulfohalovibrio reitneri TaxID=1307759 RepID=UPI0004A7349C|nr:chemotaxis protein [Desulfohalovibrio reitneri]